MIDYTNVPVAALNMTAASLRTIHMGIDANLEKPQINAPRIREYLSILRDVSKSIEEMAEQEGVVLFSENLGGNLHEATRWINQMDLAQYVVHLHGVSGSGSIAILRLPKSHKLVVERAERVARYAAEEKARKGRNSED